MTISIVAGVFLFGLAIGLKAGQELEAVRWREKGDDPTPIRMLSKGKFYTVRRDDVDF